MALAAGTFQTLADSMISDTFAAFAKVLKFKVADQPVAGVAQTYTTTETGTGIAMTRDLSLFQGQLAEQADLVIFTNASQWSNALVIDNIILEFDGVLYKSASAEKDADDAAYFISVNRL